MYYNIKEEKNHFIVDFNGRTRMFSSIEHAHEYIQCQLEYEHRLLMAQKSADMQIMLSQIELREYKKLKLKTERIEKLKKLNLKTQ